MDHHASDSSLIAQAVPFADLFSSCPTAPVNAAHRADPYWTDMWLTTTEASWTTRTVMQRWERSGRGRMPTPDRRMTLDRALELLTTRGVYRSRRHAVLAAVNMWLIASNQQIGALVGSAAVAATGEDLRAAFAVGLLERGTFATSMLDVDVPDDVQLYKPSDTEAFNRISDNLTYAERVGITAGYPWRTAAQHARHGMLATEFGLRVAEFCTIGNVVGETLSSFPLLVPKKAMPQASDRRAADLTIIRTDGLKIAVELTANTGSRFKEKVGKWVEALLEMDADSGGLAVLFLEAGRHEKLADHLDNTVRKAVADVVFGTVGAARKRVDERIAVASWADWFPTKHHASMNLLKLTCQRPTGPSHARWEPVSLLDESELPFAPQDEFAALSTLTNLHGLYGTPHWLRDETQGPDFTEFLLREHNITGRLADLARGRRLSDS